jgi:DNA-binding IclR family transcriptional regulator
VAAETGKVGSTRDLVGALLRGMRLLECFTPGQPVMTLAQLVKASGYSKTSTYRLLVTLEHAGWLERTSDAAFRLTLKAFQIGSIAVDSLDVRREAIQIMGALAAETGDSVYLVVPDAERAVCLERVDGGQAVRVADLNVGGSQPLHLGAGPRALLAFREEELLPILQRGGLEQRTASSLSDPAALAADLAETRRRGYAISRGDATSGVGALGAPVFDARGRAVAALSVGGLLERVSPEREPYLVSHLLAACRTLSARLGHVSDVPPF